MIKAKIRHYAPEIVLSIYRKLKIFFWNIDYSRKTTREVFSKIYKNGRWGVVDKYTSGSGSRTENIIDPYIDVVTEYIKKYQGNYLTIVDLGCGDFNIGKNFVNYCDQYIAIDIVPELIEHLKEKYNYPNVEFKCLDIISDVLPNGNICIIRQVFQHLSNAEILKILPKLKEYDVIIVTESQPKYLENTIPNKDIIHGSGTRLLKNSGVFLDKPPFNLKRQFKLILEIPGDGTGNNEKYGMIRTYLVK